MLFEVLFQNTHITAILKKAFTLVWTIGYLQRAVVERVVFHVASKDYLSTAVRALKLTHLTIFPYMLVHLIKYKLHPTIKQTRYPPEKTLLCHMDFKIFPEELSTNLFSIQTGHKRILTLS
jgi:hypothetical protein